MQLYLFRMHLFFVLSGLCVIYFLTIQNMVRGPAAWHLPKTLLEMQNLRPAKSGSVGNLYA